MKAIWKGSINFALVSIRVKLYTDTQRKEISFKLLHKADNAPIEYRRRCPQDNKDLSWDEIVRGYEYRKRKFVVITGDEFKALPQFASKSINIEGFVGAGEIPSIYFDKVYYMEPDEGSEGPYGLLREAIKETGKTAIARVALKEKEHLAALGVHGDVLLLQTLLYQEEVAYPKELNIPEVRPGKDELSLAKELINRFAVKFDPSRYKDTYSEALMNVINAKIEGREIKLAPAAPAGPKVVSLMEALRKSLEKPPREEAGLKAKKQKGEKGKKDEKHELRRGNRKKPHGNGRALAHSKGGA